MGILLGYKDPRGIYHRQKTKHAVLTVKIGGVDRVYAHQVFDALHNHPLKSAPNGEYEVLLTFYTAGIKAKERKEKVDA